MKHGFLVSFAAIATFGIGMILATSNPSEWLPDLSHFVHEEEPILVILVGSERNVSMVRAAIATERVVAENAGAFALREERIVAANPDAAGAPLTEAGWIDREIELIAVPMGRGRAWEQRRNGRALADDEDAEKATRIAELMKKPALSPMEAMAVLQHMDQTGQF